MAVNLVSHSDGMLRENMTPADSCKMLEDAGAAVVGMNCNRGPATMLPLLADIRAKVSCHVAGIPVPYRTNTETPPFNLYKTRTASVVGQRACGLFRWRWMR